MDSKKPSKGATAGSENKNKSSKPFVTKWNKWDVASWTSAEMEEYKKNWNKTTFTETYESKFSNYKSFDKKSSDPKVDKFKDWSKIGYEKQNQSNEAKRETMANKFLPFVVNNSTPTNIFKTIMSRSKGINQVTLASVFSLVLSVDIAELRKYVKTLPEISLEKIYEELLIKYPSYRIPDSNVILFLNLLQWLPDRDVYACWSDEIDQYEPKDVVTFFLGMIAAKKDTIKFTDLPFHEIFNDPKTLDTVFNNLKEYIFFDDSGTETIVISNTKQLETFIAYKVFLEKSIIGKKDAPPTYKLIWLHEDASS